MISHYYTGPFQHLYFFKLLVEIYHWYAKSKILEAPTYVLK